MIHRGPHLSTLAASQIVVRCGRPVSNPDKAEDHIANFKLSDRDEKSDPPLLSVWEKTLSPREVLER